MTLALEDFNFLVLCLPLCDKNNINENLLLFFFFSTNLRKNVKKSLNFQKWDVKSLDFRIAIKIMKFWLTSKSIMKVC